MEPIVVALGVSLGIAIIWASVSYLLQMVRIEELEEELKSLK